MGSLLDLDDLTECHPGARRALEELREDATCYRWLVANWGRIVTDTCWNGVDEPRGVKSIELGPDTLGSVDPESLHRAILRAMSRMRVLAPSNVELTGVPPTDATKGG